MVMEALPSPQSVGREFVRQYYTLLNKAPTHLHRFYNNHSSFVHGGLDAPNRETSPMIGQKQIHQKIQQLNFQDCHAKITQVDSQATLGDGVVVQVTGELSNAGQPMRRFTQTFVLAAQSPKKYYVHNDIFRYQDEIFTDEECDQESGRSEADDDLAPEPPVQEIPQPISQQQMAYYPPTPALVQQATPHPVQMPVITQVATVNGTVHPEDVILPPAPIPQPQIPLQNIQAPPPTVVPHPVANVAPVPVEEPIQQIEQIDEIIENNIDERKSPEVESVDEPIQEPVPISNEPKTYATLVKSGGAGGQVSFASTATSPNQQSKPTSSPPPSIPRSDGREQTPLSSAGFNSNSAPLGQRPGPPRPNNRGQAARGPMRQDVRQGPGRNSFNDDSNEDRRRSTGNAGGSQYGDSHQLFLGNLPHSATEEDLKELFSRFGPIADLRIHSKPIIKGSLGPRVPNYGFITFEDLESVVKCLSAKPIFFPADYENGQKLNVEEKKTRPRPMDGGRIGGGTDNTNNGNNMGNNLGGRNSGNGPGPNNRNNTNPLAGGGGGGMRSSGNNTGGGLPRRPGGYNNRSDGGGRSGGGNNIGGLNRGGNNFNRR